ncbi:MAG: hypothetical protein Q8L04_17005 [Ignavibacteria bacterium]|nr:hypothetical protein [Ignavibacteria bacterium]
MKLKIFFALLIATSVSAQSSFDYYTYKNTSLDVITNPASIVMGESFVANRNNIGSFIENPANLNEHSKTGLFYNIRFHDWAEHANKYQFTSAGAILNSSFATIGIAYSQFTSGPIPMNLTLEDYNSEESNQTLSLSFSGPLAENLTLGVSVKAFGHSRTSSFGSATGLDSKSAFLFDIGALYSIGFNDKETKFTYNLNLGAAFQNFGTDYKEKDDYFDTDYKYVRLPRYLKFGFAFNSQFRNASGSNDIEATLTGQYKWLTNPQRKEVTNVDYWGGGAEFTIKEIFVARAGFFQTPEYWLIFERAKPLFRFGFGVKIPLQKIGINLPFVLLADYSFIPINDVSLSTMNGQSDSKKLLRAIGISLQYGSSLF